MAPDTNANLGGAQEGLQDVSGHSEPEYGIRFPDGTEGPFIGSELIQYVDDLPVVIHVFTMYDADRAGEDPDA